jgi:hypothetical protein
MVSSTCFEHSSVHPQEDLYMQFCGWAHPAIDQAAYMDAWKKHRATACTSLSEDEHLDI